jgi:hypothetical protein
LGVFLIHSLMDEVSYKSDSQSNTLKLEKALTCLR